MISKLKKISTGEISMRLLLLCKWRIEAAYYLCVTVYLCVSFTLSGCLALLHYLDWSLFSVGSYLASSHTIKNSISIGSQVLNSCSSLLAAGLHDTQSLRQSVTIYFKDFKLCHITVNTGEGYAQCCQSVLLPSASWIQYCYPAFIPEGEPITYILTLQYSTHASLVILCLTECSAGLECSSADPAQWHSFHSSPKDTYGHTAAQEVLKICVTGVEALPVKK